MVFRETLRPWIPAPFLGLKRNLNHRVDLWRSTRLLDQLGGASSGREAYGMAARFRGFGDFTHINAIQNEEEMSTLLDLLVKEQVRRVCEIGSFLGGTLFMMTRILPDDAELFSVDWPGAEPKLQYLAIRKTFHERFARAQQKVTVIYGDSRSPATIASLAAALGGARLDFLLIDGDHSAEGVTADFQNYAPLVRMGGLIALHDIVPHEEENFGVPALWASLRGRYETTEIVADQSRRERRAYGFGLLHWKG